MITTIVDWLAAEFNIPLSDIKLVPLAGDASSRRYYRCVLNQQPYIVMQQAVDESFFNFIKLAQIMQTWGLQVPSIHKMHKQLGCLVLTDFGDDLYLTSLQQHKLANDLSAKANENLVGAQLTKPESSSLPSSAEIADKLYTAAFDALLVMQKIEHNILTTELQLPIMAIDYINDRLEVFKTWFWRQHLQHKLSSKVDNILANVAALIAEAYAAQPQCFVHLDYHSRNLLVLPQQAGQSAAASGKNMLYVATPGIIDFQDAMLGPMTYDLVSLLQDAYIVWPRQQVEKWVAEYQQRAYAAGILQELNFKRFMRWFDLVGLHRHLKNLGVFARLYHRDGKEQYLQHMPTLTNYILAACKNYPELAELQTLFANVAVKGIQVLN